MGWKENFKTSSIREGFLVAQLVKNLLQCRRPQFDSWVRKFPWRRNRLPTPVFLGFPGGSAGKEFTCGVGELVWSLGLGRSPGEWHGNPLQYSCLENPHGQRSLVGYSPWYWKESDTTEQLSTAQYQGRNIIILYPSVLKSRNRVESSSDGVTEDRNIETSYERQTNLE